MTAVPQRNRSKLRTRLHKSIKVAWEKGSASKAANELNVPETLLFPPASQQIAALPLSLELGFESFHNS